jgi:hypothetical protein
LHKNPQQKTECYAYTTKDDKTTIRYGWFTEEEFKNLGYIKVELGSFPGVAEKE